MLPKNYLLDKELESPEERDSGLIFTSLYRKWHTNALNWPCVKMVLSLKRKNHFQLSEMFTYRTENMKIFRKTCLSDMNWETSI